MNVLGGVDRLSGIPQLEVEVIPGVGIAGGVSIHNRNKAAADALPTYSSTSFVLGDLAGIQDAEAAEIDEKEEAETAAEEAATEEAASEEAEEETEKASAEE